MIEEAELIKSGVDVKKGLLYTGGNMEAYEEYLKAFYEDGTYTQLLESIERKDRENAYLHTCSLCGSSSYLGMTSLYHTLFALLSKIRNGTFQESDPMIREMSEKYEEIIDTIKKVLHL